MFTRYAIRTLLCIAVVPAVADEPASIPGRVFLSRSEVETTLIGKPMVSSNLSSGMVSRWQFHSDGRVDFVNQSGPGRASGQWVLHADGSMCVTMMARSECRYWFRNEKDGALANARSRELKAPTVAEVRFE